LKVAYTLFRKGHPGFFLR